MSDVEAQMWVQLAAALGLGTAVPALINGLLAMVSGRAEAERKKNSSALELRTQAWEHIDQIEARAEERIAQVESRADERVTAAEDERDAEAVKRRRYAEHASLLRQMLFQHGVDWDEMPPWPDSSGPPPSPLLGG